MSHDKIIPLEVTVDRGAAQRAALDAARLRAVFLPVSGYQAFQLLAGLLFLEKHFRLTGEAQNLAEVRRLAAEISGRAAFDPLLRDLLAQNRRALQLEDR